MQVTLVAQVYNTTAVPPGLWIGQFQNLVPQRHHNGTQRNKTAQQPYEVTCFILHLSTVKEPNTLITAIGIFQNLDRGYGTGIQTCIKACKYSGSTPVIVDVHWLWP